MKGRLQVLSVAVLLVGLSVFAPLSVQASVTVDTVASKVMCQCGCYAVLNNCTHGECAVRDTMVGVIKQKLSEGQTVDQIVGSFVSMYGEEVLSEPPKRGFNLTAWLAPFAALALGAGVIYIALKTWVKRSAASGAKTVAISDEESMRYRERLERELRDFPERGYR